MDDILFRGSTRFRGGRVLITEQWFPHPPEKVFPYFGSAANLNAITPPWLHFQILTPQPVELHKGTLLDYKLKLHGVPIHWRTEITAWEPPFRFEDQQLRGPYRRWIHTHTFTAHEGGTLVRDEVEYQSPLGWLVDPLFVRHDLRRIFQYRREVLSKVFE